jgi:hypothetical protein
MNNSEGLRIEPLRSHPFICVLRNHRGQELGTGSREVLEVLLYIVQKCDAQERAVKPLVMARAANR